MEIGQFTWSRQTVVLSERDGSEEELFLTQSTRFEGSLEPYTPMDFFVNHRTSHIASQDVRS